MPNSLELAYLGDAIYELHVRSMLIKRGGHVNVLHAQAVKEVCAHAQAQTLTRIEPMLNDEERNIVRRARNAHQTPPRHADAAEYHRATGFEALLGWLYINKSEARLAEILFAAYNTGDEP